MSKPEDGAFAEAMIASAMGGDKSGEVVPEYVDVEDVKKAVEGLDPEALKKANEDFVDEVIADIEGLEKAEEAYAEAEKAVAELEKTLRELVESNRKRKVFGDTPQTEMLKGKVKKLRAIMERARDKETFSSYARELRDFRKTLGEIKELVKLGEGVAKNFKRGRDVKDEDLAAVMRGYAHYVHFLVREDKVERIPREQLKAWDAAGKRFDAFGFSWTYRRKDGSREEFCPDGDRCSEHWFWGHAGDDQSMRLARAMTDLAKVKRQISEIQKKHSRR